MYAMFWLGEYANILLMCAMGAILFLGGWLSPIEIYPFTLSTRSNLVNIKNIIIIYSYLL
jgi:NADH-quinone oxidoreductase subunit H